MEEREEKGSGFFADPTSFIGRKEGFIRQ